MISDLLDQINFSLWTLKELLLTRTSAPLQPEITLFNILQCEEAELVADLMAGVGFFCKSEIRTKSQTQSRTGTVPPALLYKDS